jgi:hypothetical protein
MCSCDEILTGRQKKYASSKCRKREARRQWVFRVYGITLEEYDDILEYQEGKCAVCGNKPRAGSVLHVDHEHKGPVRGLLCGFCNRNVVGRLKDHGVAQRVADYLRSPPAIEALRKVVIAPGRPKKKRQPRKRE